MDKMKTIKVSPEIHKKLKVYSAKTEIGVTLIVEQAIINFFREIPADFIVNNCVKKSKSLKK